MNRLLLTIMAVLAFTASWADDKTDVTAKYVVNASFEGDDITKLESISEGSEGLRGYKIAAPKGWTVSGTHEKSFIVTADCSADKLPTYGLE